MNSSRTIVINNEPGFREIEHSTPGIALGNVFRGIIHPPEEQIRDWYVSERWDQGRPLGVPDISRHLKEAGDVASRPEDTLLDWLTESRTPIALVVGPGGAGKTTFVQHFFKHYLGDRRPELASQLTYIRVDLKESLWAGDVDRIDRILDKRIDEELRATFPDLMEASALKRVWGTVEPWDTEFHVALHAALGDSEFERRHLSRIAERMSDVSSFNAARLRFLASTGRVVVLFLDSMDSLPRERQDTVYELVRHKMNLVGAPGSLRVVMALREHLYRALTSSRLDPGYASCHVIWMKSPVFDRLLLKRLDVAEFDMQTLAAEGEMEGWGFGPEIPVRLLMKTFIAGFGNPATLSGVMALANSNIRLALVFANRCIESPWLPWRTLLRGGSILPWWSVLSGIMVGGEYLYSQEHSPILNLFHSDVPEYRRSMLLRVRALDLVAQENAMAADDLEDALHEAGHLPVEIKLGIEALQRGGLLERLDENLLLTPCGQYYATRLLRTLAYLRLVSVDTRLDADLVPLLDPMSFGSVSVGAQLALALVRQVARIEQEDFSYKREGAVLRGSQQKSRWPLAWQLALGLSEEIKNLMFALGQRASTDVAAQLLGVLSALDVLLREGA